jgi:hypothetical protein
LDITTLSVVGGFIIAGVTILSNIWINYLNKRNEFKKGIYLQVIDQSFKDYEYKTNLILKLSEDKGGQATLYPYEYYLIYYVKLAKLIETGKFTEKKVEKLLTEMKEYSQLFEKRPG